MKYTAINARVDRNVMRSVFREPVAPTDKSGRFNLIATNAYFKAEKRGFIAGHELDDWLVAETEVDGSGDKS